MKFEKKYFIVSIVLLIFEIIIAKYFHDDFIRPYFGDFLVIFLMYYLMKTFIKKQASTLAFWSLGLAYFVEGLQFYHLVDLIGLEKYPFLKIIIGSSFSLYDMLAYSLGFLVISIIETTKNAKYHSSKFNNSKNLV